MHVDIKRLKRHKFDKFSQSFNTYIQNKPHHKVVFKVKDYLLNITHADKSLSVVQIKRISKDTQL